MSLFTQKSVDFDFYTAELIFFYIDDYTVFKKQGFCFFPEYNLIDYEYRENDYSTVNLSVKNDFIDLFVDEKLSIKVLCGMDGCGKSTLLELMGGTKNTDIIVKKFYLFKDKNGNFASSVKCNVVFNNGDSMSLDYENYCYDFYPSAICVNHKNMQIPDFDFNKNIVKFYSETPDLYDGVVDDKLFTHFSVELWNFDDEIELLTSGSRKNLFKNENIFDIKSWLKTDILSYFFLHNLQDNSYDNIAEDFETQMNESNVDLYTFLNDYVYTNYAPEIVDNIRNIQVDIISKSFSISDITHAEQLISDLQIKIFDFFKALDDDWRENKFIATSLNDLLYFRGYSKSISTRFLYNLSDGEWRSLKYRYEIFHSMCQQEGIWWYIDEPEAYLHPEWCRNFISDYLRAYRGVKDFIISLNEYNKENHFSSEKRFTIIFATHSPFLLSDLTNDYVIYLEKIDGFTKEITADKETFAGNIGEMYNENFFMKNTIGEFARQKLLKIIEKINSNESISSEEIEKWKLLISKIGDDLLKNLLEDKVITYEKNRAK